MTKPKKLIEVAMPIKEISAESVRDKSIRHGHISTLHLWWARRPLPVCRAVVFASLVPDPLDENCPQAFKDAVNILLGKPSNPGDPYKPYDDIPYTSADDKMEDNLRNRLMMFIGKFSDIYTHNEKTGKSTASKDQISDHSLIKWDNKNNENIINKARKLIWVAFNSSNKLNRNSFTAKELLSDFDKHYKAIKESEKILYNIVNRHIEFKEVQDSESKLKATIDAFLNKMPKVFDPFAGGGAIPLEAARLGCKTYANDLNPVAHIIEKGSLEFPQKYGKPITYSKDEFIKLYGEELWKLQPTENKIFDKGNDQKVEIKNRLAFDVEFYAKKLLKMAEDKIGIFYPSNKEGTKPIAYYWARVGTCSNPSCKAKVPLLKQFYLCNKNDRMIYLNPIIRKNKSDFEIKEGICDKSGWVSRGNLICPCCGNTTDVQTLKIQFREQFKNRIPRERMLSVIWEGNNRKEYRLPDQNQLDIMDLIPTGVERPSDKMPVKYTQALPSCTWGLETWGQMFSNRQLLAMQTIVTTFNEIKKLFNHKNKDYSKAVLIYLAILVDRISQQSTTFGLYQPSRETLASPFGRQAIPMIFDFPESNPFCNSSGSAYNQLDWILRYINSESDQLFESECINSSSGDKEQFEKKFLTAVITDPPYYDAIAYADLSDFFYVWLKRTLSDIYPQIFSTPQTPKSEECTALKHHHQNSLEEAKKHFEKKLLQIFDSIEHQTSDIVSIMFAHQSTEAWTTLCNSILGSRMNITGSWAIDTEMANRNAALAGAALESSVTVSCIPSISMGVKDFKDIEKSIISKVEKEVSTLYLLGFRGADLLTACFGQAVSEFGKYEKVEKADGSEVNVSDLLELSRESAFSALLKGYGGDEYTKFYIGWLQLYGFTESDFDDAVKFSRVGLSINVNKLFTENILIKNNNKQTLANYKQRNIEKKSLGVDGESNLIDKVHRAMFLYNSGNRNQLIQYISKFGSSPENSFWRVATSLDELLPKGSDDHKQVNGLITNKDNFIRESRKVKKASVVQEQLEL